MCEVPDSFMTCVGRVPTRGLAPVFAPIRIPLAAIHLESVKIYVEFISDWLELKRWKFVCMCGGEEEEEEEEDDDDEKEEEDEEKEEEEDTLLNISKPATLS